jgi:hypothetical protein
MADFATQSPALLTTREVMALTGATARQLQYWRHSRFTKSTVCVRAGRVKVIYDQTELRRVQVIKRISSSLTGIANGGRQNRLAPLKRIPEAALTMRYLLFSPRLKLIAATDDRAELIRIATAAAHGVLLVELPAFEGERTEAAHG